jgi:DNA-binding protein HU-beta
VLLETNNQKGLSVNKTELIEAIAASADIPKAAAGRALDAVVEKW